MCWLRSLAQNPANPDQVASGQVATVAGRKALLPSICIWDSKTNKRSLAGSPCLKLHVFFRSLAIENAHSRAVRTLGFSQHGQYLASVGDDSEYTVTVWNWHSGLALASQSADKHPRKVCCLPSFVALCLLLCCPLPPPSPLAADIPARVAQRLRVRHRRRKAHRLLDIRQRHAQVGCLLLSVD